MNFIFFQQTKQTQFTDKTGKRRKKEKRRKKMKSVQKRDKTSLIQDDFWWFYLKKAKYKKKNWVHATTEDNGSVTYRLMMT